MLKSAYRCQLMYSVERRRQMVRVHTTPSVGQWWKQALLLLSQTCMCERKTMHVCHWRFASLMTDLADVAGCATFHTLAVYEMGLETLYDKIFVI